MAKESQLLLSGGDGSGTLGEDDEGILVEVVDHDMAGRVAGGGEEGGLIGQGVNLLLCGLLHLHFTRGAFSAQSGFSVPRARWRRWRLDPPITYLYICSQSLYSVSSPSCY